MAYPKYIRSSISEVTCGVCYPKPAGHPADSASEPDVIVSHHPTPQRYGLKGTCFVLYVHQFDARSHLFLATRNH